MGFVWCHWPRDCVPRQSGHGWSPGRAPCELPRRECKACSAGRWRRTRTRTHTLVHTRTLARAHTTLHPSPGPGFRPDLGPTHWAPGKKGVVRLALPCVVCVSVTACWRLGFPARLRGETLFTVSAVTQSPRRLSPQPETCSAPPPSALGHLPSPGACWFWTFIDPGRYDVLSFTQQDVFRVHVGPRRAGVQRYALGQADIPRVCSPWVRHCGCFHLLAS